MKTENWSKVSEILLDCLEITEAGREEYLDGLNVKPEIRAEVEKFLAVESETDDFLSQTLGEVSKDFFSPEPTNDKTLKPQQIGVYQIKEEIGFGGMGAVFLAERCDGKFEQTVAIKMLKREFNIEKIRKIFRREKEILATLSHPNIARLLDAGKTVEGIPYLVMEYIEGIPVDKFCFENDLELNERLKIFSKICEAVAFAHRNLIIHRDLKPSNILITQNGELKLLDFGISKLLGEENPNKNTTIFGAVTPNYASPEQIKGEAVSIATDIYSLGVVLFKILTGTYPYNLEGKNTTQISEIVALEEPFTPSAVTNTKSGNPKSKIQNPKSLKGDLDNIILKSLEKEPERRYQTVEQFETDIRRFIDGLPVSARPATFSYQASKFYKRNKIPVVAAALIILSLITGIALAIWQANKANEQARISAESQRLAELESKRANIETKKATTEKEKAEKISQFMAKVISYANPSWYAEGAKFKGDAKIIEVLDDLTDKIDTEFPDQPDVQAELHHKFAEVYLQRGSKEAIFHVRRALELRRQFYGEKHELVAKDMYYLAHVLTNDEKPDRNLIAKLFAGAIEMMRQTNPNNLNLPYMLQDYAGFTMLPNDPVKKIDYEKYHEFFLAEAIPQTGKNKYKLAETYLREALPMFRKYYKEDNVATAQNKCMLAYSLLMQNKMSDFETHYKTCKNLEEKLPDGFSQNIKIIEDALANRK